MAYTTVMKRSDKPRSGIAMGGIGAGWFEMRQDGLTHDWSIFNNYPVGTGPLFQWDESSMLFFIVRYHEKGATPKMRLLQIENKYGAAGIRGHEHYYMVPWLSGVDKIEYSGTFPFITMRFTDSDMPFVVELEAFSSFIPHDVKNSSLPAAMFKFKIISKTANPVDVMIVASMRNAVDYDRKDRIYVSRIIEEEKFKAFEMTCDGVDENHCSHGTMGIASLSPSSTWYLGWEHHHPYYEILIRNGKFPNVNDTDGRNTTDKATGKKHAMDYCFSSIACSKKLNGKNSAFDHTFAATWSFPNLYGQDVSVTANKMADHVEGHYYSNFFNTSTDVARYVSRNIKFLHDSTRAFTNAFYAVSVDAPVLDQINSHLNTCFTSSWFTKDGHFGILEGINSYESFAGLSTIDVAMYGSSLYGALFPELAKDIMKIYAKFQAPNGKVPHSIMKNFATVSKAELDSPRLDMPAQFVFLALRNFFWSGDRPYLESIWPCAKKALEYVLRERDMNGDLLPDMEGVMCSYDNFPMYGVAPYVAAQFLAAVQAAVEAAKVLGDEEALARFGKVLAQGSRVLESSAWNGKYYRIYNDDGGKKGGKDEGCLTDQIIGQWASHQCGFGYFLNPSHVKTALKNIIAMNYKAEYGLRNCQWPGDGFLHDIDKDTWIDQANTVWTGVEFAFASMLLYEGMYKDALMIIQNVDKRYRKWGLYWDHQEFGGRYFRPMSSWQIVNALLGLAVRNGTYAFDPKLPGKEVTLFFAFEKGYGHFSRSVRAGSETITIAPASGEFRCRALELGTSGKRNGSVEVFAGARKFPASAFKVSAKNGTVVIEFANETKVAAGKFLKVVVK